MDGYTYLFLQTLPIVSAVAVIFCLMGIFFGASKYRLQLKEAEVARKQLAGEVSKLRKGKHKASDELDAVRKELRNLRGGKAKSQVVEVGPRDAAPLAAASKAPATKGMSRSISVRYLTAGRSLSTI